MSPAPDSPRYVGYFDMLGMKSAVLRDQSQAWGALCDLRQSLVQCMALGSLDRRTGAQTAFRDHVDSFLFSDSVVFFTKGDDEQDILSILTVCTEFFAQNLHMRVPMRGALAHGQFFINMDERLFLGKPLIRAVEMAESAQWLGICVENRVCENWRRTSFDQKALVEYAVPLKGDSTDIRYVVDWPRTHSGNWEVPLPIGLGTFYQVFEPLFGPLEELQDEARVKYENTINFVNKGK